MPVKLFCGNDEYSINAELKKIRKTVLNSEFAELNRKVLIEKLPKLIDLNEVVELIETTPMLFGNLLLEIHTTSLFTRGKASDEKILDRLIEDLKILQDNIFIVFVCTFPKDEDKKIDSAKKIVKTIKEVGEIKEFQGFKFYETQKAVEWILKTAKSKKINISLENAALLQSYAGMDLFTLESELEKLKTYILPADTITKEDIINISQDNEDAFLVLDLWLKNNKAKLFEELDKLTQKVAPEIVVALFQTTIKRWLRIKLESEFSNADEIARIIGKHPFFVKNELTKLKDTSKEELVELRKNLNKAEFQMKSGEISSLTALEMALVK